MPKDYHCCATCQHFRIERVDDRVKKLCVRLGYDTQSHYKFQCWTPRPDIVARMDSQQAEPS